MMTSEIQILMNEGPVRRNEEREREESAVDVMCCCSQPFGARQMIDLKRDVISITYLL